MTWSPPKALNTNADPDSGYDFNHSRLATDDPIQRRNPPMHERRQKGLPMADPECVRCSACVQSCPTGVLAFGRVNRRGETTAMDSLPARPV